MCSLVLNFGLGVTTVLILRGLGLLDFELNQNFKEILEAG